MRIALINPPSLFTYGKIRTGHHCSFPLGLGYLAAYARRAGHTCAIFDPEASHTPLETMWEQVRHFNPDLIGVTCVTSNFMVANEFVAEAKRRIGCYVVMGGPHVSCLREPTLRAIPELDAVVCGEAEIILCAMGEQFDSQGELCFGELPGMAYLQDGELRITRRPRLIEDLDQLPYPARDLVDLSWYSLHPHVQRGRRSATILSSRGCPSACTFCANTIHGRRFRCASVKYFVDELALLAGEHGIQHFHMVDDCFSADPQRVDEICDRILARKLNITWFICGRVDTLQDKQLAGKMRRAGCVYVLLGVESGNQHILDLMRKKTTLAMVEECCNVLHGAGIKCFNSFIIGNEGDTEQTVMETIRFAKKLKSVMAGFSILIPFPGTYIFNKYYGDFKRPDMNWNSFVAVGDDVPYDPRHTELTRQDLLRLRSYAYRSFFLRPRQLMRVIAFANRPRTLFQYLRGGYGLARQVLSWTRKSRESRRVDACCSATDELTNTRSSCRQG